MIINIYEGYALPSMMQSLKTVERVGSSSREVAEVVKLFLMPTHPISRREHSITTLGVHSVR